MKLKTLLDNLIRKITDKVTGNGLMQEEVKAEGERYVTPGISSKIRSVAADGIVLLKNNGALPLCDAKKVAVFGRCRFNWFYVGYGSGGNVNAPYKINLDQALQEVEKQGYISEDKEIRNYYIDWLKTSQAEISDGWWGHWPMNYKEAVLPDDLIKSAAHRNDVALMVVGRAAGEERENKLQQGSYYLTDQETSMLDKLTSHFKNVVVIINSGNVIDMSWQQRYGEKLSAILYAWQGGMESGNALADILTGKINPSGKLTDTIANRYEDYPSAQNFGGKKFNNYVEDIYVGYRYFQTFCPQKALYPFGFGLSYTEFQISDIDLKRIDNITKINVKVKNIGKRSGRETVQIYLCAPQGKLGKAKKSLVAFKKTQLLEPDKDENLTFLIEDYSLASYDDSGASGFKNAYVLEQGEYAFYVGNNVRDLQFAGSFDIKNIQLIRQLKSVSGVKNEFERIYPIKDGEFLKMSMSSVPLGDYSLKGRILENLPPKQKKHSNANIDFNDVVQGKISLDDFVSALDDEELVALTRGYGCMNVPCGIRGNAGAYGGIIPSLVKKGVRPIVTTDGPAGIRIGRYASLLPCGTTLASTWDPSAVKSLYESVGEEMEHYNIDVLLGPGLNIHRNPLCGRNFEYFSEDPILSGEIAAAIVQGIQSKGKVACPKHFACNNQETKRNTNDSRVSERALREIYLKPFEICVKKSQPLNIMTSYNKINGVWSHYNYDLTTTVLREEWNFKGTVITDWWMRKSKSPEFPKIKNNAYRIRAQVDVLMPGDMSYIATKYKKEKKLLSEIDKPDKITREEIKRCAKNTLATLLWLYKQKKHD